MSPCSRLRFNKANQSERDKNCTVNCFVGMSYKIHISKLANTSDNCALPAYDK